MNSTVIDDVSKRHDNGTNGTEALHVAFDLSEPLAKRQITKPRPDIDGNKDD